MDRVVIVLGVLAVLLWSFQAPELIKIKVNDHLSVKVPESFTLVGEQELIEKYRSSRKPVALFTIPDGQVDFSINLSANQWQHFDLPLAKDFYKASLGALYSDLKIIKEDIVEINGRQVAIFEYIGTVEGEDSPIRQNSAVSKYTYLVYAMVNGKIVVSTFTAPANQQQRWASIAEAVMNSLSIKETL